MPLFFKPKPAPPEQTETVEVAWRAREVALLAELHSIDSQLLALNQAAKKFRKDNFAVIDGHVVMMCDHVNGRASLQSTWRDLAARTDKLLQKRKSVLEEWSRLKISNAEVRNAY